MDEPAPAAPDGAAPAAHQRPGAHLRIAPDGAVSLRIHRLEMGQGILTGLARVIAEELDADWARVSATLAPADPAFVDPVTRVQATGGSASMARSWRHARELGARARRMLVEAAAQRWGLHPDLLRTEPHRVVAPDGRRAGYGELAEAAMARPVPRRVLLKQPADFRLLGREAPRLDGPAVVTGALAYGLDEAPPGTKTALILRGPVFGARLAGWDPTVLDRHPGVMAFELPLARGARGLAVVADGFWRARQARESLKATARWDTEGLARADSAELLARYRRLAASPGTPTARRDDVAGLARAARVLEAEYLFPYLAHAPMEPFNALFEPDGDGAATRWRVRSATQRPGPDREAIARALGVPAAQVDLVICPAGGSFGRRAQPGSDDLVEAATLAATWRRRGGRAPVRLTWTREDDLAGGHYRPMALHQARIGLDVQGRVTGWRHRVVCQSLLAGTPLADRVRDGVDRSAVEGLVDLPYALPLSVEVHHPEVNVPVGWWRSVGHSHTAHVVETLVDEIARAGGEDPVAWRRRELARHPRHLAALELALARSGHGRRGLPPGRAHGVAVHASFGSVVACVVEASLRQGAPVVHRVTAAVHCGFVVDPSAVRAQIEGAIVMALGTTLPGAAITLKDGEVVQTGLGAYTVPRLAQVPPIDVHLVPSAEPPTGVGEPGLPPFAPALANAVAALTGRTPRTLPFPRPV
jgi:isoquinoline 1-oxidoreductase beta subunit